METLNLPQNSQGRRIGMFIYLVHHQMLSLFSLRFYPSYSHGFIYTLNKTIKGTELKLYFINVNKWKELNVIQWGFKGTKLSKYIQFLNINNTGGISGSSDRFL